MREWKLGILFQTCLVGDVEQAARSVSLKFRGEVQAAGIHWGAVSV